MKILMGSAHHSMDGKNRIRIPNKFKSEMTKGGEGLHFVQISDGCVAVMNDSVLEKKFCKFDDLDPSDEERLEAMRYILSRVEDIEEDGQGRITLSKSVREAIGADKEHTELVAIGMIDYIEIWRADIREERQKGMDTRTAQKIIMKKPAAVQDAE